jgi:hypothetical protein
VNDNLGLWALRLSDSICEGAALKYQGLILQRYGLVEGRPDDEAPRLPLSVPLDNLVVKRLPLDCQEEMSIFYA